MRICVHYRCGRKHSKKHKKDEEEAKVFMNAFFASVFNGKIRDVPQCSLLGQVLINNFIKDVDDESNAFSVSWKVMLHTLEW